MAKIMLLLPLLLMACGAEPHTVLKSLGRPEPINCVMTGQYQETCSDGLGVVWTCGYSGTGNDAQCIATSQMKTEVQQ